MKNDGGPAFASAYTVNVDDGAAGHGGSAGQRQMLVRSPGMTLRDYFAGQALQGYRAAYWQWYKSVGSGGAFADPKQMAEWSYADADAMLLERERID